MDLILIPPIAELNRLGSIMPVGHASRLHLVLSHLCDDKTYRLYYQNRRAMGEYLILDNGADELPEGQGIQTTLVRATELCAQEVVLPDVQWDGKATLEHTMEALAWLRGIDGETAYNRARRPRLMIVPQGRTRDEWEKVAVRLLEEVRSTMTLLGGPPPVVGVAKQYDEFPGGRTWCCQVLRPLLTPAEDVHLLGWAHRLPDVFEVARKHPWVRSVDSAKPLVYTLGGVKVRISESPKYPLRPDDYFELEFIRTKEFERLLTHNLKAFTAGL
jgi:hypothetical protein